MTMPKPDGLYEPHLAVRELSLPPGGEWTPRLPGWSLIQVGAGTGHWLHPRLSQELQIGTVLLLAARVRGSIRASQLAGVSLQFFPVDPERLTGLITPSEKRFLETAASRGEFSLRILPPHSLVATQMKELCSSRDRGGSTFRLRLLQLFIEVFGNELKREVPRPEAVSDAKDRLGEFLKQTPPSELLHVSFPQLVKLARCTPRHLSRIFREVVGMSFRDKHAELRLARACVLLATTESKVVDVALESGYQSLSLFNLMFTRRFGISPGGWRRKHRGARLEWDRLTACGKKSAFSPGNAAPPIQRPNRLENPNGHRAGRPSPNKRGVHAASLWPR